MYLFKPSDRSQSDPCDFYFYPNAEDMISSMPPLILNEIPKVEAEECMDIPYPPGGLYTASKYKEPKPRGVVPGGAGGAMALHFGRSVNPIASEGRGRLCPPNNTGTPGFSDLLTPLKPEQDHESFTQKILNMCPKELEKTFSNL